MSMNLSVSSAIAAAGFPDMPQNAMAKTEIDHGAPVAQICVLMTHLAE